MHIIIDKGDQKEMGIEHTQLPAALWAKKSRHDGTAWLPLLIHLADCAQVARLLWKDWVPEGVKHSLASGFLKAQGSPLQESDLEQARNLFIFLAASHDLGKATPCFQYRPSFPKSAVEPLLLQSLEKEGFRASQAIFSQIAGMNHPHHSTAGQVLLEHFGLPQKLANVVGAHHGKPGNVNQMVDQSISRIAAAYGHSPGEGTKWRDAQKGLVDLALSISGWRSLEEMPVPDAPAQLLLSALVIIADWIASAEDLFPLFDWHQEWDPAAADQLGRDRARIAMQKLKLPQSWIPSHQWMQDNFFTLRFGPGIPGFQPHPAQQAAVDQVSGILKPGILVLEAPMGSGKTETALAIAEIFAQKSGRDLPPDPCASPRVS